MGILNEGDILCCKICGRRREITHQWVEEVCKGYFHRYSDFILYDTDIKRFKCPECGSRKIEYLSCRVGDAQREPEDFKRQAVAEQGKTTELNTALPGSTKPPFLSHEDEWNGFLKLVSRADCDSGSDQRQVAEVFSRLIRKQNPLAIKAQQEIIEYEKPHPGAKTSSAYDKGALFGMANLYSSAGDACNPKIPYEIE